MIAMAEWFVYCFPDLASFSLKFTYYLFSFLTLIAFRWEDKGEKDILSMVSPDVSEVIPERIVQQLDWKY